jgi:hypothetical protein
VSRHIRDAQFERQLEGQYLIRFSCSFQWKSLQRLGLENFCKKEKKVLAIGNTMLYNANASLRLAPFCLLKGIPHHDVAATIWVQLSR